MSMKEPMSAAQAATDKARFNVPYDLKPLDAVREISGQAVCHVEGVLGLKGGLGDVFKKDTDLRRGITVDLNTVPVTVRVRIIGDATENGERLVRQVRKAITEALDKGAGVEDVLLDVELAEQMSREDFTDKYGPDRSCSVAILS